MSTETQGRLSNERTRAPQPTPTTYGEAAEVLGSRDSRKIAHNTRLERLDFDAIGVRLHSTYVVTFFASGMLQLDSGGWRTLTTKERMNRYLPTDVSLYQKDRVWYILDRRSGEDVTVDYTDGMVIS